MRPTGRSFPAVSVSTVLPLNIHFITSLLFALHDGSSKLHYVHMSLSSKYLLMYVENTLLVYFENTHNQKER